jgi:tripartite-type tricarboxylate transporter receptor subunit TctC
MDISIWWSVIAHGDTPKDIVAKLNNVFNEARKQPAIQKMQADYAFVALPYSTPAEIGEKAKAQIKVMEPAIRKAGIKLE